MKLLQGLTLTLVFAATATLGATPPEPMVEAVDYKDGDFSLVGYVSVPSGGLPAPGVVIVVCFVNHFVWFH